LKNQQEKFFQTNSEALLFDSREIIFNNLKTGFYIGKKFVQVLYINWDYEA
jgi:hypothetical protein